MTADKMTVEEAIRVFGVDPTEDVGDRFRWWKIAGPDDIDYWDENLEVTPGCLLVMTRDAGGDCVDEPLEWPNYLGTCMGPDLTYTGYWFRPLTEEERTRLFGDKQEHVE